MLKIGELGAGHPAISVAGRGLQPGRGSDEIVAGEK